MDSIRQIKLHNLGKTQMRVERSHRGTWETIKLSLQWAVKFQQKVLRHISLELIESLYLVCNCLILVLFVTH